MSDRQLPETIRWEDGNLYLLDQRQLPNSVEYLHIENAEDAWHAIKTLAVRGAPAIGIAAAYGLAVAMRDVSGNQFVEQLQRQTEYLKSARPTAVNLAWAVDRLNHAASRDPSYTALVREALAIHAQDRAICAAIGAHGASLIKPGSSVLTHCNAGALAVSELGTATAPMYHQHSAGVPFHVYVDETRPLYQGARLTAWELDRAGIDVTLICDNMAASVMAAGKVDLVMVGTDRVTANGDVVNKIGTLNLAILCKHYDIPFYVACPSSTYDGSTASGAHVQIEERPTEEVRQSHAAKVNAFNPAFDVTPADLVTAIITERGIAYDADALGQLVGK